MFIQIITHTPIWVWAVFVLLLWLGFKQSLPSTPGIKRITLIPLAMLGLSLYGLVSVFGSTGTLLMAWVCPAALAALAAFITVHQPAFQYTKYNFWTQRFELPGSWVPLVLMLVIFMTKYGVAITAVIRPDVLHNAVFSYSICALYGVCSGVFAGRALRLWGLVWSQANGTENFKWA